MTREQVISGIVLSLIATLVGWLTNRASNKASVTNVTTSSRVEMEKEAYERARKMDTQTIERQDSELLELEGKFDKLKLRLDASEEKNEILTSDLARMTLDNYQVHRESNRVLEMNEQLLAENARLRSRGDLIMEELNALRLQVNGLQRGADARGEDTNPMMPEVSVGGE